MQGVSVNERPREVTHMNKFSEKSVALLVADRVRPTSDGSLRGWLSHGASFSVALPRTVHPSSHRLFPVAQPASAFASGGEDIDSGPDFGRRAALEVLMRTKVIVKAARVGQGSIQRARISNGVLEE